MSKSALWKIVVAVVVIAAVIVVVQVKRSQMAAAMESPAPVIAAPEDPMVPPPANPGSELAVAPPATEVAAAKPTTSPASAAASPRPQPAGGEVQGPPAPPKPAVQPPTAATKPAAVAKPLPRMVELGSTTCIPCKMMEEVMAELRRDYAGKLEIEFINVNENPAAAEKWGIRVIPTQVLLDNKGQEFFRHEGFWPSGPIVDKFKEHGLLP